MVPKESPNAIIVSKDNLADIDSYISLNDLNDKKWERFFTSEECDVAFTSFKECLWGVKAISGRKILEDCVLYRVEWNSSNGRDFVRLVIFIFEKFWLKIFICS